MPEFDGPEFANHGAIITGGASGIGLATARLLTARGAKVAVLDRDISGLGADSSITALEADVTDDEAVRAAVAAAAPAVGSLHILRENAGTGALGTIATDYGCESR